MEIDINDNALSARGDNAYFLVALAIHCLVSWANFTVLNFSSLQFGGIFSLGSQILVLGCLSASFLQKKLTPIGWLVSSVLILVGFIAWRVSAEGWLFWTVLFIVCAEKPNMRHIATIIAITTAVVLAVSTLYVIFGFVKGVVLVRSDNGTYRYAFGYLHPNNLGTAVFTICCALSYVLITGKKPRYYMSSFLCVICALFCLYVPVSKSTFVCLLIVAAGNCLLQLCGNRINNAKLREICIVCLLVFISCVLVSIAMMVAYDGSVPIISKLSQALSARPYYAHLYYEEVGLTPFGYSYPNGPFVGETESNFLVDNAYEHILLRYGFVTFAILFIGIFFAIKECPSNKNTGPLVLVAIAMIIYGLTETACCRIEANFILIFISSGLQYVLTVLSKIVAKFNQGSNKELCVGKKSIQDLFKLMTTRH